MRDIQPVLLSGVSKGALFGTRLCLQSVVCYMLCSVAVKMPLPSPVAMAFLRQENMAVIAWLVATGFAIQLKFVAISYNRFYTIHVVQIWT